MSPVFAGVGDPLTSAHRTSTRSW